MAAAKLCCTVPFRSDSPDDVPSRHIKHFRSLANIKAHFSNSRHASVTDGHMDENQLLYPTDDLELQRIFVTAALPEDHPDALRIRGRKPGVDETIIRSPSFTNKLRRQLSRKSLATGKSSTDTIKRPILKPLKVPKMQLGIDLASFPEGYDQDAQSLNLSKSRLASLRSNNIDIVSGELAEKTSRQETVPVLDIIGASDPLEPRRSISVPITSCPPSPVQKPRRPRSSFSLCLGQGDILTVKLPGPTFLDPTAIWSLSPAGSESSLVPQTSGTGITEDATVRLQASSTFLAASPVSGVPPPSGRSNPSGNEAEHTDRPKMVQKESTISLHLQNMQIAQHLRTRSELSDGSSLSNSDIPRSNRATHASLNSVVLSSLDLVHRRDMSSSGFGSSTVPSIWGKVMEDESSSIYSRRPSTGLDRRQTFTIEAPYELPTQDVLCVEPQVLSVNEPTTSGCEFPCDSSVETAPRQAGLSLPTEVSPCESRDTMALCTSGPTQATPWPHHGTISSLPKSDSSGSLGKLSKFKEDLANSPNAKTSKKRRSVLRILFPKLLRTKIRSASTPLLTEKRSISVAMYDGTGDAADLLSVPKPAAHRTPGERAVSFSDITDIRPVNETPSSTLAPPSSVQSRQSMEQYERNLSVAGDNRRRKSTLKEPTGQGVHVDDRHDSIERGIRRASPLFKPGRKGTEEALMERALQQHQLEKAALLRTNSKKTEATVPSPQPPVFTSPFGDTSPNTLKEKTAAMDDLDPLDAGGPSTCRRSQSMQDFRSFQGSSDRFAILGTKKPSTAWTISTAATEKAKDKHRAMTPPSSWSQFPSHTRVKRCSTAGQSDGIFSRDFAYSIESPIVVQTESTAESLSSAKRLSRFPDVKKKNWIVKSRSMTFGAVFRYYSTLLTSSAARNRRSSVATGGRLEHPELEVLPPMLISEPLHSGEFHHMHAESQIERPVDTVEKEGLHDHHRSPSQTEVCSDEFCTHGRLPSNTHQSTNDVEPGAPGWHQEASANESEHPVALDGTVEDKPADAERTLSARRLSRMYQTCVQLPTSLDDTEVESNESREGCKQASGDLPSSEITQGAMSTTHQGFLTVPSTKARMYSGPIVRRFPSATIVDDRKGHWRSISLISVDSGKSVRKSTRDLLEFVKATESQELAKLMGKSSEVGLDETPM